MADVMVTGRMSQAKKDAGNSVLQSLGLNASQAINQLYDYLIAQKRLPFNTPTSKAIDNKSIEEALAFVRSVPQENSFSAMSDEEIKLNRLIHRGLISNDWGD